jgi:putative membrane protein (TIGR04086 family)
MQHHDSRQTTPAPIEPTGFFTGIQFRPIISGVVLDTLMTIVLVSAYYYGVVAKAMPTEAEAAEEAFAQYWNSVDGLMMSLLLGSLGTMIGGFYAAYKAGTLEIKHGALVGIGSIILGLALQAGGSERQAPEWFMALSLVAAIPAGALGGFFAEMFRTAFGRSARISPGRG